MNTASNRLSRVIQNGLLAIYAIFALFPLIWMIILSFKSDAQMYNTTFIFTPTLANYKAVLSLSLFRLPFPQFANIPLPAGSSP